MEDTLKRPFSVIEGGQQSPTCANETGTGFAPLMEDKGLFVFEGSAKWMGGCLFFSGSGVLMLVRHNPHGDDEVVYSIPSPTRSRRRRHLPPRLPCHPDPVPRSRKQDLPPYASRSPEELMALFIDHAESHRWAKAPKPSATDSWIGRHGGTETYSDIFALHNTVRNHFRVN